MERFKAMNVRMEVSTMRFGVFACMLLAGCAQAPEQHSLSAGPGTDSVASLADESCLGFTLVGLKYSPGGTTLPHTCKPFDAVTNNPYAIRCIDAMPDYKTPWASDEFCILPPPPDKGLQLGVHPQGVAYWDKMYAGDYSDYSNPALTEPFVVKPGTEVVQDYDVTLQNTQAQSYFRVASRMRDGSHHIASWFNSSAVAEGWEPVSPNTGVGTGATFFNAQSTHSDRPSSIDIAPEDKGLGMSFPAHASVAIQLHHINPSPTPVLREVWINLWYTGGEAVTPVTANPVGAPIDYPPNTVMDNVSSATATGDTRIVTVFGHRHAWTTRFSAQIIRANGEAEEMYDSFSWLEMPTYNLDNVTTNPVPNITGHADGASSGLTVLHKGDKLQFACHVDTTESQARKLGVPPPTSNLHFANQAFGGEMCILYLETTGPALISATPLL
jgi:hypothetical protein